MTGQERRDRMDELRAALANLKAGLTEDGKEPKKPKE